MRDENEMCLVRYGGDPTSTIKIEKGELYKFNYKSNIFNIRKISVFIHAHEGENLEVKVDIYEKTYNSLVGEAILRQVDDKSWNELEYHDTSGIFEEELEIVIKVIKGDSITLGIDKNNIISSKFMYEKYDNEISLHLDKCLKDLRKIYNSNGWIYLVKVYRVRDVIKSIIRLPKRILKGIYIIFKSISIANISRGIDYIKDNGIKQFVLKVISKFKDGRIIYNDWIKHNLPSEEELNSQRSYEFDYKPLISILMPTYKTPKHLLVETIESVMNQTYTNWEFCIADGNSQDEELNKILNNYSQKDKRFKVKYLSENKGIAGNTQECYYMANGDYIGLFDHDDLLEPNALFEIVKAVNKDRKIEFIYTDEDKITEKSDFRFDPHFKQDYAVDTLRSYNYICHFSVFRKDLMDKIGGFRDGFNGSQDYDIILRATEVAKNIHHIPKILYSWRVHSGSTAGNPKNKMYCYDSAKKAIDESLKRRGIVGKAKDGKYIGTYRIEYEILNNPKVSILIPNKDHIDDLDRAIKSILSKTDYLNYEIIIIENNSELEDTFKYYKEIENNNNNIKVVFWDKGFNYSAINNYGATFASGEYILLLNNDVEVINNDWLTNMLQLAQREDVGCVGAKLYYPDKTIQHGGIIVGLGGAAAHAHRGFKHKEYGYFLRLGIVHNISAVTGACLLVKKSIFEEVNGLDESFEVAYNDVDFCLRVLATGRVNVWTPYAELYHYESKSRGVDDLNTCERFKGEFDRFRNRYEEFLNNGDPYYNPNLTLDKEDFSYKL